MSKSILDVARCTGKIFVQTSRMNDPQIPLGIQRSRPRCISQVWIWAVDAGAAVSMALNWTPWSKKLTQIRPIYLTLNSRWKSLMEEFPKRSMNFIRKCRCYRDINHTYRGDFDIVLQSPDGTESWLAVSNGDSNEIIPIGCSNSPSLG
ncbi:MAG: hypothetical protein Ct9H90mP14_1240 [Methanobacteriota archaeon]|nr:MAG: hypothetical protein Ct9H90mP14_1240 [Euryarchaeota archaeon]